MPDLLRKLAALLIAAWTSAALALPSGLAFELCACGEGVVVCEIEAAPDCCETSCCEDGAGEPLPGVDEAPHRGDCATCMRVVTPEREPLGPAGDRTGTSSVVEMPLAPSPFAGVVVARARPDEGAGPEVRPLSRARLIRPLRI